MQPSADPPPTRPPSLAAAMPAVRSAAPAAPRLCALDAADLATLSQASTFSWRLAGEFCRGAAGTVSMSIDGEPCEYHHLEWDDRAFTADGPQADNGDIAGRPCPRPGRE